MMTVGLEEMESGVAADMIPGGSTAGRGQPSDGADQCPRPPEKQVFFQGRPRPPLGGLGPTPGISSLPSKAAKTANQSRPGSHRANSHQHLTLSRVRTGRLGVL